MAVAGELKEMPSLPCSLQGCPWYSCDLEFPEKVDGDANMVPVHHGPPLDSKGRESLLFH